MAEATFNKQDIIGFKQSFFLSDASAHASYQWLSAQSQPTCNIAALALSKLGSAGAEVPALDDAQAGSQQAQEAAAATSGNAQEKRAAPSATPTGAEKRAKAPKVM